MAVKAASAKQVNFLKSLLSEKAVPTADRETIENLVSAHDPYAGDVILSSKQASAYIDFLMKLPRNAAAQDAAKQDMPDVPAGRYAVRRHDGEIEFFKVDRPTRGKWAGYTFLARMHGENHEPIKARAEKLTILLLIAGDIDGAARLYGHKMNHCGFCLHDLTDKFSRFYGVGPVCRRRHGMPISEADYRKRGLNIDELDEWLAEDARFAEEEAEKANREWAEMKNEFARREAEQEAAAYEAKMRRDEALFRS